MSKTLSKKQIINRTLRAYRKALSDGSKMNKSAFFRYLMSKDMHYGICRYNNYHKISCYIYKSSWIIKHCNLPSSTSFWYQVPANCSDSKSLMVAAIKARINILKKELSTCK